MARATLGTAGHIDHGKTSLVEALTGRNTDRLPEEQARGISIALGYAPLDLGDGVELSVVDVPGHERFVRTMVAGATGIDLALVCVACDDGVMPQTREHLAILELLGVERGVIALTKRDLVDDDGAELAGLDVEDALAGSLLEGVARVEVSARTGAGLPALRDALRLAAADVTRRRGAGRVRLPIDRAFSLRGIGTVVTGTLWSGALSVGDHVRIEPGGAEGRVRSLQVHDRDAVSVDAGSRVAASLTGIDRADAPRGSLLVVGTSPPPSYRLDVRVRPVPDAPLPATGDELEVLHGTAQTRGRVVRLDASGSLAQLRLVAPLATLRGDRLVLRTLARPTTIAGATVGEPLPARHGPSRAVAARLAALLDGDPFLVVTTVAGAGPFREADVVAAGLLEADDAAAAVGDATAAGTIVALADGWLAELGWLTARGQTLAPLLRARAADHPLAPGLPSSIVGGEAASRDAVIGWLERTGVLERQGGEVLAPGARASSAAADEARNAVLVGLEDGRFSPPRVEELLAPLGLAPSAAKALVLVLEREGTLVRLPDDLAVSRAVYDEACAIVTAGAADGGTYTLAQLRDATGTSRKWAQALLERMDADGLTRRVGDHRVLRRRATQA
jgi:selenocysteine-specific elongation factor